MLCRRRSLSLWYGRVAQFVNQTLAALALLVTTLYLRKQEGLKYLVTGIPCVIMLVITNYAMVLNQIGFMRAEDPNRLLVTIGAVIFALALWMTFEAFAVFFRGTGRMPTVASA